MRPYAIVLASFALIAASRNAECQARRYALTSLDGLRLHSTAAAVETFQGERSVRLSVDPSAGRNPNYLAGTIDVEPIATVEGLTFTQGVIEAEVAGSPEAGATAGARGFVGIAFRVQGDGDPAHGVRYDAFYLRPTNGRAEDQERRNHSVQYISHPEWTWERLRRETPSRYEAYVDLQPGTWTKIRIEVRGAEARLYVHGQPQPVLIVHDLKTGPTATGGVALWIGTETVAHFRNLVVTPQ
jgi:hypothetical protein